MTEGRLLGPAAAAEGFAAAASLTIELAAEVDLDKDGPTSEAVCVRGNLSESGCMSHCFFPATGDGTCYGLRISDLTVDSLD